MNVIYGEFLLLTSNLCVNLRITFLTFLKNLKYVLRDICNSREAAYQVARL